MSSIFVIIHQDEIRVIERTAKYEFEPVHIHCEPKYKIIDANYTYVGNDLYNQLIDHLNVSNLTFCKLFVLYHDIEMEDLWSILQAFRNVRQLQLLTVGNMLCFIAAQKKLYGKTRLTYLNFEQTTFELKFNEYNYFSAKVVGTRNAPEINDYLLAQFTSILLAM
nr:hypothetical protein [uncultured Lysinibacillus sp.]